MMAENDTETIERAMRLGRMMNDRLRAMTPQERDRTMQIHLAQARGPVRNAKLLCEMTAMLLGARQTAQAEEEQVAWNPVVDVIAAVVEALEAAGIEYAIAGGVASGIHGEPFSAQRLDMIVRMTPEQAQQVAAELPQGFYCNEEAMIDAARNSGMVNVVDMDTTLRVDLCVVASTPLYAHVFQRRQHMEFGPGGPRFDVVSAEDIVLMKLVWRKESRSTKQWENALSVARVKGARMDWKYLFEQARSLGIENDLIKLRDEAGV